MKVISIRAPWASLIVAGFKDIENRKWTTGFRGPVAIHSGKTLDLEAWAVAAEVATAASDGSLAFLADLYKRRTRILGGVVGFVDLVDCVHDHDSPWFGGPWGFVLANPAQCEFLPMAGQLSLFNIETPEIEAAYLDAYREPVTEVAKPANVWAGRGDDNE